MNGAQGVWPAGRTRKLLRAASLAGIAYYALFRLPFRWPPQGHIVSASYAFGFNNRAAFLALAAMLAILSVWYAARPSARPEVRLRLERARLTWRSGGRVLFAVTLLYTALTLAMYMYTVGSEPHLTWESRHFIHRLLLMDEYGLHPYTDFQAEYGPILTSTPLYAYRLLRPFGATREQAYFACHLLLNVAGLAGLYWFLWRVTMPPRRRVVTFVLLACAGFGPYMGLNGVLLRYLAPFASVLLVHRAVDWTRDGSVTRWVALTAAALALLGVNILISPEVGLAFALAWLSYAVLMVRYDWRVLAVSSVSILLAGASALLLPAPYYGSLLRFSEGANNLPLLPAPFLLLYVLTIFLVVPPLLGTGLRAAVLGDGADAGSAALGGALGGLCVVLAPGALGRADPPHVLFYGLGVSMLLMIRLANVTRRRFVLYTAVYGTVHILLAPAVLLTQFYGVSPRLLLSRGGVSHVVRQLRSGTAPPLDAAQMTALNRYPRLGIPFATFGNPLVERYVIARGRLAPEYYIATVGVYTEASLARKLEDIAGQDYLLIPRGYEVRWSRSLCAHYLDELRRSTLYPAQLPCSDTTLDVNGRVNAFILDHYRPLERVGDWYVMGRLSAATRPARPLAAAFGSRR